MGINGTAYASYTAPGAGGTDVRVSRLSDHDVDAGRRAAGHRPGAAPRAPATSARASACRPRATGSSRGARRRPSASTPAASPGSTRRPPRRSSRCPTSAARPAGGPTRPTSTSRTTARSCGRSFRQDFGGGSRAIARRMLGSTFDPPVAARRRAGLDEPADRHERPRPGPRDVRDAGRRRARATSSTTTSSRPPSGFSSAASAPGAEPKPGASEHRENVLAWRVADGAGNASIKGRLQPEPTKPFEPEVELSRPDLGAVPAGRVRGRGRPARGLRGGDGPGRADQPRDHRRAPRPPAGPPGRDRPQRVAERPAGEARVAPGP